MNTTNRRATRALSAIMAILSFFIVQPGILRSQVQDHEEGFFLRLSAGGGAASTEVTDGANTVGFSGSAGDINFAIGGIVASNLALHGTLFGWTITEPDIEVNGQTLSTDGDLTLGALGAGVTYYFMPVNIYLSGSVGFGRLEYKQGSVEGGSLRGLVFDATVGKEWWVGDSWGLGVALGLGLHSIPEEGVDDNWSGGSVTLRFTATMN